jgi:hypothetical protein
MARHPGLVSGKLQGPRGVEEILVEGDGAPRCHDNRRTDIPEGAITKRSFPVSNVPRYSAVTCKQTEFRNRPASRAA